MTEETKPGVGPHPQPWPVGEQYNAQLLAEGDHRNVLDRYRYWTVEAIKKDLDATRLPLEIAIENVSRDFNMGTIVRSANAFNISKIHIIGSRQWNKRGAMVTDVYMNIVYHPTVEAFMKAMHQDNKTVIAIDIVAGAEPLSRLAMPEQSVLVFGAEGPGLSQHLLGQADSVAMIEQIGSTRSINVGVAAGIAMYMWLQKHSLTR